MLATFFSITPNDVASTTAYAGGLIGDFMPIIVLILGIAIGIIILKVIFKLF